MNILKADAFSNRRGLVLDTFTFADRTGHLELNPSEVDRLRTAAEKCDRRQDRCPRAPQESS